MEGRGFRDLRDKFRERGTEIYGISFDSPADNKAFAEKYKFTFPMLCDVDRKVGLAYGACDTADAEYARRITYVIGPEGTIVQAWPKVSPSTHPGEVLSSL